MAELAKAVGLTVGLGTVTGERRLIDECDICTSENLDWLMRTKPDRMANVSVIVADEFHLLNDTSRGPTLEINLTRLRHLRPEAQITALSATVGNVDLPLAGCGAITSMATRCGRPQHLVRPPGAGKIQTTPPATTNCVRQGSWKGPPPT